MLVGSSCKKLSGDCSTIKIVTDENDILYHYTNFGGFSGIIKSQKQLVIPITRRINIRLIVFILLHFLMP